MMCNSVVLELGVKAHPQKFWFAKNLGKTSNNLGKEASTIFNNVNEITFLLLSVSTNVYHVIANTLNIYKINNVFLVTVF